MLKRTLFLAAALLCVDFTPAQDVKSPPAKRADTAAEAPKPTKALRALAAAQKAIQADENLTKQQKRRALRSLNGVRRALGVKVKGKGRRGQQAGDDAKDAGADSKKGARKRKRNKGGDGAGAGAGAEAKKRKKKKNKGGGDVGKSDSK